MLIVKKSLLLNIENFVKKYAEEQVEKQKGQFQRLGILGEWDNPYITYTKDFESEQIKVFAKMVKKRFNL